MEASQRQIKLVILFDILRGYENYNRYLIDSFACDGRRSMKEAALLFLSSSIENSSEKYQHNAAMQES